jgi:hypothetical protein
MNGDRGEVCVGLFSLKPIAKGEEITIDFDYDYYDTAYSVYCSCDFDTCIIPFTAPRKASLSAVSNSALLNLGDDQKILQKVPFCFVRIIFFCHVFFRTLLVQSY